MPDLVKYQPALPVPAATGNNVALLILELLAGVVAPEAVLPVLFTQFVYSLTNPQDLAAYTNIVANVTTTISNILSIIKGVKDLKIFGDDDSDALKRIANALYVTEGEEEIPIAQYMKKMAVFTPSAGSNAGTEVNMTQILYSMYANTFLILDNGKKIPFAEALSFSINNGSFRYFQEIPLDGGNAGG